MTSAPSRSLAGIIDTHIHSAPDVRARLLDDVEVARQAAAAGMRAIVLKSHVTLTADRAVIAARQVGGGLKTLGGLALNRPVGGLNPFAVDAALRLGAKIVWLPTSSAVTTSPAWEGRPGISLLDESGRPVAVLHEIARQVRDGGAILATGHVPPAEIMAVLEVARAAGLERVVITHPESDITQVPVEVQRQAVASGALLERTLVSTRHPGGPSLDEIAAQIRATGVRANMLSTDFGQPENPPPVEGMATFLDELAARGFSEDELRQMAIDLQKTFWKTQPSALLVEGALDSRTLSDCL